MTRIQFQSIETNNITLHVITAGPEDGRLILLLHGFPDFWYGWRKQVKPLADRGFKVVIPDQRGYNKSDKPAGVRSYDINMLRDDVIGLIRYFQQESAIVIGHDWGGAVAWHLATTHPELIERLIVINMPHPAVMPKVMVTSPTQWLRSSYIFFFQFPKIPEKSLSNNGYEVMKRALRVSSRKGTFTDEELDTYVASWEQPGALTAMLNWYRSISRSLKELEPSPQVTVPTKMIWGVGDLFLSKVLAKESLKLTRRGTGVWISEATHWVHLEYPEIVNEQILKFISR